MTLATLAFWVLAVVGVLSALAVVQVQDIFKAALFLILSFLTFAGLFVLLNAEFLAAVQVLIYAGAIAILIIFAVMLTRDVQRGNPSNRFQGPAFLLAALLLAAIVFVAVSTDWPLLEGASLPPGAGEQVTGVLANTIPWLAQLLLRDFVLPFEVASVLLLAAVIGAIVLIRER